jgi:hypothetical protein
MRAPIMAHIRATWLFYREFSRIDAKATIAAGAWVPCVAAMISAAFFTKLDSSGYDGIVVIQRTMAWR